MQRLTGLENIKGRFILLGALLIAATCAAYIPAIRAGYIWDDDEYVLNSPTLHEPGGLGRIWTEPDTIKQYYPLTRTTFWLEYRTWGLNPAGYHAVNILLHGLNALLLWMILRRLRVPGAYFATLLFALHPVNVESVAWITERKNVLSGLFYLLALLSYLRYAGINYDKPGHMRDYLITLIMFVCALLSKTVTATFPAVVLLLLWWKKDRVTFRDVAYLVPFFVIGIGMGLHTAHLERNVVGAQGTAWNLSFLERGLIAGRALWFYAGKLILPVNLTFIYPRWNINPQSFLQYLFPAAAIIVPVILWLKRKVLGRGPLVATLIFAGTLFPALGFFNIYPMQYSFVADHFQYLASAALLTLLAAAATIYMDRAGTQIHELRTLLTTCLIIILASMTWKQATIYRNIETLWLDTLAKNPACWMAHVNLGKLHSLQGNSESAIQHYQQALDLNPLDAGARNNLAIEFYNTGNYNEAIKQFKESIRIWPNYPDAYYNLARAYEKTGNIAEAENYYKTAILCKKDYLNAYLSLADLMTQKKRVTEATGLLRAALHYAPNSPAPHYHLALLLYSLCNQTEAIMECRKAVQLAPDEPEILNALAWMLATSEPNPSQSTEAVILAKKSCNLTGYKNPAMLDTLAATYADNGDFDAAIKTAEKALDMLRKNKIQDTLIHEIENRLTRYRKGEPHRECSP